MIEFAHLLHHKKPPANNDARVEAHLGALQHSHRLAIHMFENDDKRNFYPRETLSHLKGNEKQPLAELVRNYKSALLSMSLLPRAGHSIRPYGMSGAKGVAYLFDLSMGGKKEPPLVVKCLNNWDYPNRDGGQIFTGRNNFSKNLHFYLKTDIPALDALYEGHISDSFKKAVADDPSLSQKQLDAFGEYHETVTHASAPEAPWNELVAAVTREHIAAIAVTYKAEAFAPWRKQVEILRGALAGLEHLKHGMDLPVVLYNINEPDRGTCTYLAQGKEACTKIAIEAIRELQKENYRYELDSLELGTLRQGCKALLGVDLDKPIQAQRREWGRA